MSNEVTPQSLSNRNSCSDVVSDDHNISRGNKSDCVTNENTLSNWGTFNRKSNHWTSQNNNNWSKSSCEEAFRNRDSSSGNSSIMHKLEKELEMKEKQLKIKKKHLKLKELENECLSQSLVVSTTGTVACRQSDAGIDYDER